MHGKHNPGYTHILKHACGISIYGQLRDCYRFQHG